MPMKNMNLFKIDIFLSYTKNSYIHTIAIAAKTYVKLVSYSVSRENEGL